MRSNLKAHRRNWGLTLQGLGDRAGLSKSHIWELEKGSTSPTLETAYKIAMVLDVRVYDIWPDPTEIVEEVITMRRIKQEPK